MGQQAVGTKSSPEELRLFIRALLNDVRSLEQMISNGMIEAGARRIGAELELVLVNSAGRPAPLAIEVLSELRDHHFTNEIGLFNVEINLDPLRFGGDCLSQMQDRLEEQLALARAAANRYGADVILTGILPTLRKTDLELCNMTQKPRYIALNDALKRQRGRAYEFNLKGADELIVRHDTWMLEACCTSFQIHFQSGAEEFANLYNIAQVATAPALAAAVNSPLLFGKRLWNETRIPLFEQSVDTRDASYHLRELSPRVSFGNQWVRRSVLELFREDIARFRVLLGSEVEEDSLEELKRGRIPQLVALRLFNGTVWRWNRACYGVTDGRPHLRIETRAFPAGPTVLDQVANAAFFFGLMQGLSLRHSNIAEDMAFDDAKTNFLASCHQGLDAQFKWIGGRAIPVRELIRNELVPLAREGLGMSGVADTEADRYLSVIEERVRSGQTGAQWQLDSFAEMSKSGSKEEALTALTDATIALQKEGRPVHEWPLAATTRRSMTRQKYLRVEEFMTTDLFTVYDDEPIELVANLMSWKRVRHIPVEDEQGRLVGLVSSIDVLRELERSIGEKITDPIPVGAVMVKGPLSILPETPTLDAIAMMRRERVDCLPVVREGRLVGIVTERDFINLAARLLEQSLDRRLNTGDHECFSGAARQPLVMSRAAGPSGL
ncbi:MAG TPA: CBS domain-containing protein [Blastocatellia bacterium]|nr:CBS domain-containing protein [Blastocatellia bacterium]